MIKPTIALTLYSSMNKKATEEIIAGLRRFDQNEVPAKLEYEFSHVVHFTLDATWESLAPDEDVELHRLILPSQIHSQSAPYAYRVGDSISFSRQYDGGMLSKCWGYDYRVTHVNISVQQSVSKFYQFTEVEVAPLEEVETVAGE